MAQTTRPRAAPAGGPAPPRLLRPVRRRRLGLGVRQGDLLVRPDDHAARLPPGPGVLLHGPEDRRPRPAPVGADQLLPAVQRDAAVSRADRRDAALAAVTARDPAAGRPRPTASPASLGQTYLYVGGSDGTAPGRRTCYVARARRQRQPRRLEGGPAAPRGPLRRPPASSSAARCTSSAATGPTASPPTRPTP